ncbi:EamA family transporter [bacterium]|nr:EamA family transporter [bacterium]
MLIPVVGWLALLGRTVGLGLERPFVKALGIGRNSIAATTVYFGIGEILLIPLIVWQFARDPNCLAGIAGWIAPALLSGVIYTIAFNTYVWGMSVGEVSYLTPLYSSMFIFLYILDIIFGDALLAPIPVIGITAVVLGIIFLNIAPGRRLAEVLNPLTVLRQPGAWGMLVYAFCLAAGRMVDSSAADVAPPVIYAFINNSLCVLFGIVYLASRKKARIIVNLARERLLIAAFGSFAGMYAYVLMLVALDYFNPSLIEPVTQLSVFIAIALGGIWFGEPTKTRWLPAALVVIGATLLLVA